MADTIDTVLAGMKLTDLVEAKEASTAKQPKFTAAKVTQTIEKLKDMENSNGYLTIAKDVGLWTSQVKEIHTRMKAKIVELTPCPECGKAPFCECTEPEPVEEPKAI